MCSWFFKPGAVAVCEANACYWRAAGFPCAGEQGESELTQTPPHHTPHTLP